MCAPFLLMLYFFQLLVGLLSADECASRLQQARQAARDQDFALAAASYRAAVTTCPFRSELLLELAKAQLMAQQVEDADQTLVRLLKVEPRHADALKLRGDTQYLLGNEAEAERLFRASSEAAPKSAEPHYALGRLFYHQTQLQQAAAEFRRAIELDPAHYRAYDNLGLTYDALNDIRAAMQSYEKALALVHKTHPTYDTVFANLADLLHRQGDFERSFQFASEAAKRNPRQARNFYLTGRALAKLARLDLAEKWLKQAVTLDPKYGAAHYQLAQIYRMQGRTEEADRALEAFQSSGSSAGK